jgi:hypothetical protein
VNKHPILHQVPGEETKYANASTVKAGLPVSSGNPSSGSRTGLPNAACANVRGQSYATRGEVGCIRGLDSIGLLSALILLRFNLWFLNRNRDLLG